MTERGLSDLIGYVLVFSLVALAVGFVAVAGVSTLNDAKAAEQASNAERAFDVMADNMQDVYQAGAPNRATEISLADAALHTTSTATINVSGWNTSGGGFTTGGVTSDIIVWENTDGPPTRVVYAFGTVLRSQRQGGVVTRSGPFRFDGDRTILPIVETHTRTGNSYADGIIRVRSTRSPPQIRHTGAAGYEHLWLNVTTAHPFPWVGYLDGRSGTKCTIRATGGDTDRVTCELSTDRLYVTVYPMGIELER